MHKGTERLMPWRTLIEVAKTLNTFDGYEVKVVSSSRTDAFNFRAQKTDLPI